FPARFPVSVPDAGSKLASDVSPTVQRNGASGTGVLSAASAWTWNLVVPWIGSGTSSLYVGLTASCSTVRCTTMSTVFVCSSPTITPFWSTLAISGRSDFQVTATGAAGEPSSLSARGDTRVFSEGSRYTVGGSIRSTAAGPEPTT